MEFKNLIRREDRAVSPVIGVILMVAITVILAAVIGAFVLGLGESIGDSQAPTVSASASSNSDYPSETQALIDDSSTGSVDAFYISHTTGDELEMEELRLVIRDEAGAAVATFDSGTEWNIEKASDNGEVKLILDGKDAPSDINSMTFDAGSTITVEDTVEGAHTDAEAHFDENEDYTIQIIHRGSGSTVNEQTVSF